MTTWPHEPKPGTVIDRRGTPCSHARPDQYPLSAWCWCGEVIRCADPTADWTHG